MKHVSTWLHVWLLLLLAGMPLLAHGMKIEVRVDAQAQVVGKASYGAHPIAGAQVSLVAPDGKLLGEVKTNPMGAFSCAVSHRCDVRVVVSEGGHRGERLLPASAFPSHLPIYGGGGNGPAASTPLSADAASLTAVVEAAVARRLEPVELLLQRQADAMRLRDILGGLGYILGLAGIAFYFAGRARTPK